MHASARQEEIFVFDPSFYPSVSQSVGRSVWLAGLFPIYLLSFTPRTLAGQGRPNTRTSDYTCMSHI